VNQAITALKHPVELLGREIDTGFSLRHRMGIDDLRECRHDGAIRIRVEMGHLSIQALRHRDVVRVHARQVATPSLPDAEVERSRHAEVAVVREQTNPRVVIAQDDGAAGIRRGIIEDEEFEVRESLGQDAVDRLVEELFSVADRHENGDQGRGLGFRSLHRVEPTHLTHVHATHTEINHPVRAFPAACGSSGR
jgi:hypothetical protein